MASTTEAKIQTAIFVPNQWYILFGDDHTSEIYEGTTQIFAFLAEIRPFRFC